MIAATLFNCMAMTRGLAAHAVSRGTLPDTEVPQLVRDGLLASGIDIGNIEPKGLRPADARGARLVVTFDVDLPRLFAPLGTVRRWDDMPSVMESFDVARHAIAARVTALISEFETAPE